jgi:polar amino acid transport system permease protein
VSSTDSAAEDRSPATNLPLILVSITVVLSLLYAVQHYAGGPIRLAEVSRIQDLVLSPDNSMIAAGADDGRVYLWNTQKGWEADNVSGHRRAVVGVAMTPDSATLISASRDGEVRLWDVDTGQVRHVIDTDAHLSDLSLAGDGSLLAVVGDDGRIRVFDVASGEVVQAIGPNPNTKLAVALNADGTLVAADDGTNIRIWDPRTGDAVRTLANYCEDETKATLEACEKADEDWLGHEKPVTALAFSPDGELLASGSADTTIIFWEVATGKVRWPSIGHWATVTDMTFHPDGSSMLSGGEDNKIRSWRVPGGKSTAIYEGHLSGVNGVAFGWGPTMILSGGADGTVRVWETANQKVTFIVWAQKGLQPVWGDLLRAWMLISGMVGLVSLWGLWKMRPWGHLLALFLYVVGPIVVVGLPLLEVLIYPLSVVEQLSIAWPLIVLLFWYVGIDYVLMRQPVAISYEAPESLSLSERLMASQRTRKLRSAIFIAAVWFLILVALYSVLRRFNLDVAFMRHFFSFIMGGAWITLRISALSISLAVVLALLGALGRLSKNPVANGISGFYISLIRGTPLLVQIYIWYLGLPRVNVVLPAQVAGTLALGVNYGAYMTEIFRAGIQAIGKGQYEAAEALGMSRTQLYRRIVLPQAFRIVIPPIGNQFIAMMKDSSLVSVMSIWELSYRAQKIGRQNFRSLETFMVAAGFYWVLTVVFQFLQGQLEEYMARSERR